MSPSAVRSILVATDFGPASTRALELASEMAQRYGAELIVLHAIEPTHDLAPGVPPEVRRAAGFQLKETVKQARKKVRSVEGVLREGMAWHEITDAARQKAADLVVVGTHGLGHGERAAIGSVAEKVIRICPVPVITVHAWRFPDRVQAGRELAELLLRHDERLGIVVALSRGAAVVGAEVAEAFGTSVELFFTRTVEREGRVVGAVCEDGTIHWKEGPPEGAGPEIAEVRRAREELSEEATRFASFGRSAPAREGTIALVCEAIVDPAPITVAAGAMRERGCGRLVAAAPVGTAEARDALKGVVDAVYLVQVIDEGIPLVRLFRDSTFPPDSAIADRLSVAAEWAHAVKRRP